LCERRNARRNSGAAPAGSTSEHTLAETDAVIVWMKSAKVNDDSPNLNDDSPNLEEKRRVTPPAAISNSE
jgi:hypothetical protein